MSEKKVKVVVIGTGNVAGIAIRCLQGRENIELVGVWGHSRHIGEDAGLLDTNVPAGVLITASEEEIYALKPDCAVVALNIRDYAQGYEVNGGWYRRLLEHGINVVTPSDGGLVYPPAHPVQEYVESLRDAAVKGGVTFYCNGQEPGFVEHMAMLATTMSNTIKRITSFELFNYSTTKDRNEMSLTFGFDEPEDYQAILEGPGIQLACWGSPLMNVANILGYEVERFEELYEKRVTTHDIPVGWGTVKAGKVAAIRIRTSAIVAGREAIVVEHVNRLCDDIAPEWQAADTVGCMRVVIEGDPNISMECSVGDPAKPQELSYDGYVMTAMRIVNAIPYVVAAPAGIATFRDLPITAPSSAFRSDATFINHKICKANT
jgi:hypothetical protein